MPPFTGAIYQRLPGVRMRRPCMSRQLSIDTGAHGVTLLLEEDFGPAGHFKPHDDQVPQLLHLSPYRSFSIVVSRMARLALTDVQRVKLTLDDAQPAESQSKVKD